MPQHPPSTDSKNVVITGRLSEVVAMASDESCNAGFAPRRSLGLACFSLRDGFGNARGAAPSSLRLRRSRGVEKRLVSSNDPIERAVSKPTAMRALELKDILDDLFIGVGSMAAATI